MGSCNRCGDRTRGFNIYCTICTMDIKDGISFCPDPPDEIEEQHNRECAEADNWIKKQKEDKI